MMGLLPVAVLPTYLHIIFVLHSGNNSSSRDCPIVLPAAAAGWAERPVFKETQTGSEAASVEFLNFVKIPMNENTIFGEHSY